MKRNIRIWFRRMFFVFVVMLWLETGGRQTVKAYGDSGDGLKDQKVIDAVIESAKSGNWQEV